MKLPRNDPYIEGTPPHPPYLRGDRETGMTEGEGGMTEIGTRRPLAGRVLKTLHIWLPSRYNWGVVITTYIVLRHNHREFFF
jgi:hypothetical protein